MIKNVVETIDELVEENQKLSHQNEYLNSAYIAECNRADELEDSLQQSWRNERKLKELLKECEEWIDFLEEKSRADENYKGTMYFKELLTKIDEVLK